MAMSSSRGTLYSVAADSNSTFKEDPVWAKLTVAPAVPSRTAPASPAPPSLKNSRRAILGERSSEHIFPPLVHRGDARVVPCLSCLPRRDRRPLSWLRPRSGTQRFDGPGRNLPPPRRNTRRSGHHYGTTGEKT